MILKNIVKEAIDLFEEKGWIWNDKLMSFVETRNIDRETTAEYKNRTLCSVSYSELRDNGLAGDIKGEIIQHGLE